MLMEFDEMELVELVVNQRNNLKIDAGKLDVKSEGNRIAWFDCHPVPVPISARVRFGSIRRSSAVPFEGRSSATSREGFLLL